MKNFGYLLYNVRVSQRYSLAALARVILHFANASKWFHVKP